MLRRLYEDRAFIEFMEVVKHCKSLPVIEELLPTALADREEMYFMFLGMVTISGYRLVEQGGVFFCKANGCTVMCPICGGELFMRSLRSRTLIDTDGKKIILMIRRLICGQCRRLHHELPDIVVPYKRHSAETIEAIIGGGEVAEEKRTVRRIAAWWQMVEVYFLNIMKSLGEKYRLPRVRKPAFRELVRAAVNSGNWIFAGKLCTRSASESWRRA